MARLKEFDEAWYARWRARFPWTDEQFAQAHEEVAAEQEGAGLAYPARIHRRRAEACRRGHVSSWDVKALLRVLVKKCDVPVDGAPCGKTALYRIGAHGRCRAHRLVKTQGLVMRLAQHEVRNKRIEGDHRAFDAVDMGRRSWRRNSKAPSKRG